MRMNLAIILPVLVCLLGLVLWLVASAPATKATAADVGRIMFAFGLLVSLMVLAGKTFHLTT